MGFEAALLLAGFVTTTPVELDVRPPHHYALQLDVRSLHSLAPQLDDTELVELSIARSLSLSRNEPVLPATSIAFDSIAEMIELCDATAEGDWARQVDYELVAQRGPLTIAFNQHFIVRNISEAQFVASWMIEY